MSHWCYTCLKYPTEEQYETICKEKDHDIDFEDQFNPTNKELGIETPKQESETHVKKLLKFIVPQIKKLVISESDSSRIYGLVSVNNHLETIEIGTGQSINWLKAKYFEETKDVFSEESYKAALDLIISRAPYMEQVKKEIIYKRCAFVDNTIYYDLCSSDWKIVKITKDSIQIIQHGIDTPLFSRSKNQSLQVEPNLNPQKDALDVLSHLLRIDSSLFKIHLVTMFVESIPIPTITMIGQQGSIKSTQSALIKKLIDPTGSNIEEQLSHLPRNIEDLNLILATNYYVAFDNISYIDSEQSDIFCKTITGASYARRKKYTDSDLVILKIRRKFGLNGITVNIANGDLLERSIIYYTGKVPKSQRKTESKVLQEFREIQADVLGCIFLCLQNSLRIINDVEAELKELPRMADFAIWGEAISQSIGNPKGKFIKMYNSEIESGIDILSEATPLIPFLQETIQDKSEWIEQAQRFYQQLMNYATQNQYDSKILPKAPNKLRDYVRRNQPLLEQVGIEVEFFKNTQSDKWKTNATLISVKKLSSGSSGSSDEHTGHSLDNFSGEKNETL